MGQELVYHNQQSFVFHKRRFELSLGFAGVPVSAGVSAGLASRVNRTARASNNTRTNTAGQSRLFPQLKQLPQNQLSIAFWPGPMLNRPYGLSSSRQRLQPDRYPQSYLMVNLVKLRGHLILYNSFVFVTTSSISISRGNNKIFCWVKSAAMPVSSLFQFISHRAFVKTVWRSATRYFKWRHGTLGAEL